MFTPLLQMNFDQCNTCIGVWELQGLHGVANEANSEENKPRVTSCHGILDFPVNMTFPLQTQWFAKYFDEDGHNYQNPNISGKYVTRYSKEWYFPHMINMMQKQFPKIQDMTSRYQNFRG